MPQMTPKLLTMDDIQSINSIISSTVTMPQNVELGSEKGNSMIGHCDLIVFDEDQEEVIAEDNIEDKDEMDNLL